RFHRHLKSALKAREDPSSWVQHLPLILLGLRSSFKEDLKASAAELVYGTTLRLPGDYFVKPDIVLPPSDFVEHLRFKVGQLQHCQPRRPSERPVFVFPEMEKATHVFLRQGGAPRPLCPPYSGPHKVIQRDDKFFKIDLNGKEDRVHIDRLK